MKKPKGKTPSLLSQSTGMPSFCNAKQKITCSRCKENINKGESIFRIPKLASGFTSKKPYCLTCFRLILNQTNKDLTLLEADLENALKNS